MSNFPSVPCGLVVSGGQDPTVENDNLFVIGFMPKDLDLTNKVSEEVFEISQAAGSVKELREYLAGGVEFFDGEQNWFWVADDEEKEYIEPLPAPFNKRDAYVQLTWAMADVSFDAAALLILDLHDKVFREEELKRLDVGELKVIRAVKGCQKSGSRKLEVIDDILDFEKASGCKGIRVIQSTLEVVM